MEIILHYEGALNADFKLEDKNRIRKEFHRQLYRFWQLHGDETLKNVDNSLWFKGKCRKCEDYGFIPLVSTKYELRCALDIQILKDGLNKMNKQYDLDNRLKLIFDCLRSPLSCQELNFPSDDPEHPKPFYTLLEDDWLVDSVCARKGDWIFPPEEGGSEHGNQMHFHLLIKAKIYAIRRTKDNWMFPLGRVDAC